MKITILLLTFMYVVCGCYGWALIELKLNDTVHEGHCYSETRNVGAMESGEERNLEGCVLVECHEDTSVHFYGCPNVSVPGRCHVVEEKDKPYPECCARVEC